MLLLRPGDIHILGIVPGSAIEPIVALYHTKIMTLNLHSKLELWPLLRTQTHDICLEKAIRMIQRLRLCWAKCVFNLQIVTPWFQVHPLACEGKYADAQGNVG